MYLTRFNDFHGTAPALKDVYVIKANDVNTRILMIQGGDADIAIMPIEYENLFTGKSNFYISKGNQTLSIDFIGFNLNINTTAAAQFGSTVPSNFFADKNVRLAFAHLFNYGNYIANVRKGNAILPNGPIPKGMFGYNASQPTYTYDLAMARSYFENATNTATGHSWWTDGFSIAFMFNAGNTYREAACQYMKDSLESLGSQFKASLNQLDWPTYLANMRKSPSPFPAFWLGWAPDYNDPDDYVVPMLQTGGSFPYRTSYSNATIDALIPQAASETDATARQALYDQITNLTYQDVPYIWLAQPNNFHVERSWMHGFSFNPMHAGFIWSQFTKS
jgi:peptide/nickel transport system substrate-binding protein